MKRIWRLLVPLFCLCLLLCGCSMMDGEYVSVTPNRPHGQNSTEEEIMVSSYQQVQDVLSEMVESGVQDGVMYITNVSDIQATYFISTAIAYIRTENPIGVYAVNRITYEIGTNMGKRAIAVKITYNHNRSEILRIKQVRYMEEATDLVRVALENYESSTVIKVKNYTDLDLVQFVEDYVSEHPDTCMEMPQVTVSFYPNFGYERVMEIFFTYQSGRDTLRLMQQSVSDVFMSARFYVDPHSENSEKFSHLYSFLMERYEYTIETSITPSYSLLRHGVGDSKAFASGYAAMCRQVGLTCEVISGTKAGEAWHWNAIRDGDTVYHLDLLECKASGYYTVKTEEEMTGYVWDYTNY